MTCYYNDEKATAETIKDGWLYTGDMAEMDEDGFIYLVDRKKEANSLRLRMLQLLVLQMKDWAKLQLLLLN